MSITHLTSTSHLNSLLAKSSDKLSVIDFHAEWCGPCHQIAPAFEALSRRYKDVNFFKCDVDKVPDVAQLYRISAMPTFIFLKGSTKVDQVRGADRASLESAVAKYSTSSSGSGPAFSGKGQTLGGSVPSAPKEHAEAIINLDPQAKLLLGLVGAYLVYWLFLS
ncbi:thioredoxin-domain-containing protein [Sistotremastrum niveocremeum HHB9708]|uniref:Thioredoxin-domain-containing protein n=2 Tax=Sistotremastraceae TaxID=3402574 RepID=A0A164U3D8_9AGAM|nr:thioredoxin-domain-containing protein [Sistotremastrum niveocremeum HHB9708]KZT44452.1 thioredoxin-domain-containing protein [Sistotremastrum suecicum HHB10207 ss-3]